MEKENIIKIAKYNPELFPQFKMLQKKLSQYERDITNEHCPYTLTNKVTEDILEKMMQDSIDLETKQIKTDKNIYLIKENENYIGFINFTHNRGNCCMKPRIFISSIFIKEEHRGRGYGKKLMQKAEEYAIQENEKTIMLSCLSDNKNSINFYKNNNYKPWATTFIKRIK
ncbi:MAG: GNAT family N-acetyltransferase [Alphaproteobacteria bacterium]|nr:GNAT family N-acetyltransferase [Alphaproteobacteria bacterium]